MKNRNFIYRVFITLFFLISCQTILAQRDTIVETKIFTEPRSLQFGAEFLNVYPIDLSDEIPDYMKITEFSKCYTQNNLVYDPVRDPKRLVYNTGLYFGAALASFAILWVSPESFSNWDKDKIREEGLLKQWKENVKAGPVWDNDSWYLNWVMHPWVGAVYYMSARGSGFKLWESFVYSAFMSTFFWEYGVEAFAEIPSWQDLLITPILGSVLGEGFFIWKGKIIRNDRKVLNSRFLGGTSLFLMDPFNQILNGLGYKTKNKIQTYSTVAPIDYDMYSKKTTWGMQVVVIF